MPDAASERPHICTGTNGLLGDWLPIMVPG
jgi:hypothetical protein